MNHRLNTSGAQLMGRKGLGAAYDSGEFKGQTPGQTQEALRAEYDGMPDAQRANWENNAQGNDVRSARELGTADQPGQQAPLAPAPPYTASGANPITPQLSGPPTTEPSAGGWGKSGDNPLGAPAPAATPSTQPDPIPAQAAPAQPVAPAPTPAASQPPPAPPPSTGRIGAVDGSDTAPLATPAAQTAPGPAPAMAFTGPTGQPPAPPVMGDPNDTARYGPKLSGGGDNPVASATVSPTGSIAMTQPAQYNKPSGVAAPMPSSGGGTAPSDPSNFAGPVGKPSAPGADDIDPATGKKRVQAMA